MGVILIISALGALIQAWSADVLHVFQPGCHQDPDWLNTPDPGETGFLEKKEGGRPSRPGFMHPRFKQT